jgi:hypothetical protein
MTYDVMRANSAENLFHRLRATEEFLRHTLQDTIHEGVGEVRATDRIAAQALLKDVPRAYRKNVAVVPTMDRPFPPVSQIIETLATDRKQNGLILSDYLHTDTKSYHQDFPNLGLPERPMHWQKTFAATTAARTQPTKRPAPSATATSGSQGGPLPQSFANPQGYRGPPGGPNPFKTHNPPAQRASRPTGNKPRGPRSSSQHSSKSAKGRAATSAGTSTGTVPRRDLTARNAPLQQTKKATANFDPFSHKCDTNPQNKSYYTGTQRDKDKKKAATARKWAALPDAERREREAQSAQSRFEDDASFGRDSQGNRRYRPPSRSSQTSDDGPRATYDLSQSTNASTRATARTNQRLGDFVKKESK